MAKDPYKLLGVPKTASDAEIRKAYRALAKKYHPDVNKDPKSQERFKEISAAHTLLSDKDMKKRYDSCLLYTSPSPRDKRQSRMPSSA